MVRIPLLAHVGLSVHVTLYENEDSTFHVEVLEVIRNSARTLATFTEPNHMMAMHRFESEVEDRIGDPDLKDRITWGPRDTGLGALCRA